MHGWPKLTAGPVLWEKLGGAMAGLGVTFAPAFWGFMAAFAEFGGGIALILGIGFRTIVPLLIFTMVVAATKHLTGGDGLGAASHAIENACVLLGLFLSGPGAFSVTLKRGKG